MKNLIESIMLDMINYFGNDVKRINHAIKVYGFAKTIGAKEKLNKEAQFILEISAILHDIGIKVSEAKYNSSAGKYQEIEGPDVAKELLKKYSLSENTLNRILHLIGNHHTYGKINSLDFQILVEADFIVNIFEDSLEEEAIKTVEKKYFKTETGINIIEEIYMKN